jgi:hypothetical protein
VSAVAPAPSAQPRPRRPAGTQTTPRRPPRRRGATLARPRAGRSPLAPGVLWVLLVATLLGGIVALNVGALRNSIETSRVEGTAAQLRSENSDLQSLVARRSGAYLINHEAAQYGMVMAQPLRRDFLRLHPKQSSPKAPKTQGGASQGAKAGSATP